MELTSLQKRNIESFEKEIATLKKYVSVSGWYYILIAICATLLEYFSGFLFDYFMEHKSFSLYVNECRWTRIIFSLVYWLVFFYLINYLGNKKYLNYRLTEYKNYRSKLGLDKVAE